VRDTGGALDSIVGSVGRIEGLVSEIAASAEEQSAGLGQVNTAVNQMDQVVQQNAAMVEQSTAATHALKAEMDDLARALAAFRVGQARAAPSAPRVADERAKPRRSPVHAMTRNLSARLGAAPKDGGWEEF
jgi:methyl-accepting chemotaxis protein